jgi:hypothetical protein
MFFELLIKKIDFLRLIFKKILTRLRLQLRLRLKILSRLRLRLRLKNRKIDYNRVDYTSLGTLKLV